MGWWTSSLGEMLVTFVVAMVPVIELRGAIPFGVAQGLPIGTAIVVSVLGNLVPVPFIILFVRKVFAMLRRWSPRLNALVERLEKRAENKRDIVDRYAFWGLVLLVAIPLPGTGAWTGSLVAAMMEMRMKKAFPAVALGVILAGVIVAVVTYGVVKIA